MATAWRKRWPPPRTWYGGKGVPVRWCQAGAAASKRGRSSFTIGAPKNSAQCCRSWWYRPVIGALKKWIGVWRLFLFRRREASKRIVRGFYMYYVYQYICLRDLEGYSMFGKCLAAVWWLACDLIAVTSFSFDWRSGHNKRKQTAESFTQMSQSEGASFNSDKKP